MQRLDQTLRSYTQRLEKSTSRQEMPMENLPSDDELAVCPTCRGQRVIRAAVAEGDPRWGKAQPCPVCVLRLREAHDWFTGLDIDDDNRDAVELAKGMAGIASGWLVICGPVGTGKTTLARAILSTWAGRERQPQTVSDMLLRWQEYVTANDHGTRLRQEADAPLAVLDDLGAHRVTDWRIESLGWYLDWRYARRLPTVITTNLDAALLAAQVGDRIADRVFDRRSGLVQVVSITGPSRRTGVAR